MATTRTGLAPGKVRLDWRVRPRWWRNEEMMSNPMAQFQMAQRDAGERAVIAELQRKGLFPADKKPRAVEAGRITSLDLDGSTHATP